MALIGLLEREEVSQVAPADERSSPQAESSASGAVQIDPLLEMDWSSVDLALWDVETWGLGGGTPQPSPNNCFKFLNGSRVSSVYSNPSQCTRYFH
jgi:hypothetical protein